MKVTFSAEVEVPDGTPMKDIENWLRFELGATGQLDGDNALVNSDLASIGSRNVMVRSRY